MTKAARSVLIWSVYAFVIGVLLAAAPNFLLSLFGIPETDEVWIRILGFVVILLALYYWDGARNEARHLFVASVLGRVFVVVAFVVLVVTGEPWQLLLFAAVDLAGALYTLAALRADTVS